MRHLILPSVVSTWMAAAALAQPAAPERIVVPLAEPGEPAFLGVSLMSGGITVEGYDGAEVVIEPAAESAPEEVRERDGMFRIPNTSLGLSVEQEGNRVSIDGEWGNRVARLTVRVPRRTSVHAGTINAGEVLVRGVTGDHELENVNGGITVEDVSGSVVASTTNGQIAVSFVQPARDKPMSFSSFNGDVEVTFPADFGAALRIKVAQGEILSDFEVTLDPQPTTLTRKEGSRGTRFELENEVRGVFGGGGPEIRFETFNGDVRIRKRR